MIRRDNKELADKMLSTRLSQLLKHPALTKLPEGKRQEWVDAFQQHMDGRRQRREKWLHTICEHCRTHLPVGAIRGSSGISQNKKCCHCGKDKGGIVVRWYPDRLACKGEHA